MFVKADMHIFQNEVLVQTWLDTALVEKLTYTHWIKKLQIYFITFMWLFVSGWNDLHSSFEKNVAWLARFVTSETTPGPVIL